MSCECALMIQRCRRQRGEFENLDSNSLFFCPSIHSSIHSHGLLRVIETSMIVICVTCVLPPCVRMKMCVIQNDGSPVRMAM